MSWTKTLQNSDDIFSVCIAPSNTHVIDPVKLYMDFIHMFPMPPCMPAFSFKSQGKLSVLTQSHYSSLLKHHLELIGVPSASYSSHSASSLMHESGVDVHLLKHHGTWKSSAYQRYITYNHSQKMIPTQKMYSHINKLFGQ